MPKRILIADDDPDMVEMLRLALGSAGYAIRTAVTGGEALRKALASPPDLVLLDLMMPGLNGFSVCERLRNHAATASVPIMMVTGLPGEFARFAGMEVGADVYIRKPFDTQQLISQVAEMLLRTHVSCNEPRASQGVAA